MDAISVITLVERMDYLEDKINLLELQMNKLNDVMRSYNKLRSTSLVDDDLQVVNKDELWDFGGVVAK